jgi:hypothetical protein
MQLLRAYYTCCITEESTFRCFPIVVPHIYWFRLRLLLRLLVAANILSSLNLFTLIMEAIRSSETSVLKIATRCHTAEDVILQLSASSPLHLKAQTDSIP